MINIYSIVIGISVILTASVALVILLGGRDAKARSFAIAIVAVSIINGCIGYFTFVSDYDLANFGIRATFAMSVIVALILLYFAITVKRSSVPGFFTTLILITIMAGNIYGTFYTDLITGGPIATKIPNMPIDWVWAYGKFSIINGIITLIGYITSLVLLHQARSKNNDILQKKYIGFILIGFYIGGLTTLSFNTFLPMYGLYQYIWIGPTSSLLWISIIVYAIAKYNGMNIRLITTEVLIVAMIAIGIINVFFGQILGLGASIIILIAFVILGILSVYSSIRELRHEEALRDLNANLAQKVEEQIREIRAAYEIERKAHMELEKVDKAKNQFIMITQHHLRTPITSIKWQLESILAGTYGNTSPELKRALGDMSESIERLSHLINSLLSISALKAGIETLSIAPTQMSEVIDEVIKELHKEIERKNINLEFSTAFQPWPLIPMDRVRMIEVIFIIIENAIKYNVQNGHVIISGRANESKFELTVENTGQELSTEDKNKIFSELFYRSAQAQVAHPTGMGIGLSMAQAIIEAHRGTISLSSRKIGGGVKVMITLPY